jgi:predicted DNA-binding ribbon-helix-helix protein
MGRPVKRSFTIAGHRTSISLEAPFWEALKAAAEAEGVPVARLIARIDATRDGAGLSSAVRVWLLAYYRGARAAGPDTKALRTEN